MRTRHLTTALIAVLLLGLTACAKTTPEADEPKAGAEAEKPADDGKAALEAAVRAYSDAYFKPDAKTAHGMMSARCAAKVDPVIYKSVVEQTVKDLGHHKIKTLTVDQMSGDLARVTYTYDVPKLDQKFQPWVREDGTWKYDGC